MVVISLLGVQLSASFFQPAPPDEEPPPPQIIQAAPQFGIWGMNAFSETYPNSYRFGFDPETAVVFNGVMDFDSYWDELLPGSEVLIPIIRRVGTGAGAPLAISTMAQLNTDNVTLSYIIAEGEEHVLSVGIVDSRQLGGGGRNNVAGLPAGAYLRIAYREDTAGLINHNVVVNAVLNVNRISQPDSEIEVMVGIASRRIDVYRSTVFGALLPTVFEVDDNFSGEVTFDMGGGVLYTNWVMPGWSHLINFTTQPIEAIEQSVPEANVEFRRFMGGQSFFAGNGLLAIQLDEADFLDEDGRPRMYVYTIGHGGAGYTLTSVSGGIAFDRPTGTLFINTVALVEWVISSQPLPQQIFYDDAGGFVQSGYAPPPDAPEVPINEVPADITDLASFGLAAISPPPEWEGLGVIRPLGENTITHDITTLPAAGGGEINVTNIATHNPPTGRANRVLPLENVMIIALASLTVAAWQVGKKIKGRR